MTSNSSEHDGLYAFDEGSSSNKSVQISSCLKITSTVNEHEISLWHFRLGHPSFHYLKNLFPELFKNNQPSQFQCEISTLAKQHRASYSPRFYQFSKPFYLIHNDIWGPSRVTMCFGKGWFVTFIDGHS